jgi:hypothetical protein
MLDRADADDVAEGRLAYRRYNAVMADFAECYGVELGRVVAAFVALSPNSDYFGNLRSLASVLCYRDAPAERVTVSTYNHCKLRALGYVNGDVDFLATVKGPKIRSFFLNIVDPVDPMPVTVDGHIHAAWLAERLTMKEAIIRGRRQYEAIAADVRELAASAGMIANQVQAAIWYARKRHLGIVYDAQLQLFGDPSDKWRTIVRPCDAPPYPLKPA